MNQNTIKFYYYYEMEHNKPNVYQCFYMNRGLLYMDYVFWASVDLS